MAEHPSLSIEFVDALRRECQRLEESCLYYSTTLFLWLRAIRTLKWTLLSLPVLFGSLASWTLLTKSNEAPVQLIVAVSPFLATLLPGLIAALKIDNHIQNYSEAAGEFKFLQNRFRQAALVTSLGPLSDFKSEFEILRDRHERARAATPTTPEWCFTEAREKIHAGHYSFAVDEKGQDPPRPVGESTTS